MPTTVTNGNGTKAIEYKRFNTIANATLVKDSGSGRVRVECQFELSGSLSPVGEGTLQAQPVASFQYQSSFYATLGKTIVLVDEPGRHIEVQIDRSTP